MQKINDTKSWFFEEFNKLDKPLAKLTKKKKKVRRLEFLKSGKKAENEF